MNFFSEETLVEHKIEINPVTDLWGQWKAED